MPEAEHQHAHGPANRGRIVLTTAAPLFVCEPPAGEARQAVVALHGPYGITAEFERGLRTVAAHGYLVVAPFHYFRDGGPEYVAAESARDAFAALAGQDVDADVDAAIEHVILRLRLRPAAVVGAGSVAAAVRRARERHPDVAAVSLPEPMDTSSATLDAAPAVWAAAVERLDTARQPSA